MAMILSLRLEHQYLNLKNTKQKIIHNETGMLFIKPYIANEYS